MLERVATEDPDIALVDISMPGPGLTAILDRIRESGSACRVIALTMHLERSFAFEMIDKGLAGYVTKDAVFSEVLEATRSVPAGKTYLCRQIASPGDPEAPFSDLLTPREMQCFKLAAQGLTNKAIAQQLDISDRTAKFHLENIYHKLGAERRGEAIAKARAKGIVV